MDQSFYAIFTNTYNHTQKGDKNCRLTKKNIPNLAIEGFEHLLKLQNSEALTNYMTVQQTPYPEYNTLDPNQFRGREHIPSVLAARWPE
jgi:hypothetical protein